MPAPTNRTPNTRKYFTVGDKRFNSDLSAYMYASAHPSDERIAMHLDYDLFRNKQLWQVEPPQSIDYYNQKMAKWIGDNYDKVFVMYSGGTDSHTMLDAFIKVGVKGLKLLNFVNIAHENTPRALVTRNVKKNLEKYKSTFKKLNYEILFDVNSGEVDRTTWESLIIGEHEKLAMTWEQASSLVGWGRWYAQTAIDKVFYDGNTAKKACVVWGYEKPNIVIHNDWWCWQAGSTWGSTAPAPLEREPDNIRFFFDDAVPEIQIKQSWIKINTIKSIMGLDRPNNNINLSREHLNNIQSVHSPHYQFINQAMGYQAVSDLLNGPAWKAGGSLARETYRRFASDKQIQKLDNLNVELWDTEILNKIDDKYISPGVEFASGDYTSMAFKDRRLLDIPSDPIPIMPYNSQV